MGLGYLARTRDDLLTHWRPALAFHLLMQLLGLALVSPLLSWTTGRLVASTGEPVISNFDIAGFVLSPAGIGFVLAVAALAIGLLLAEFAGQTWIAGHAMARRPVSALSAAAVVARNLPRILILAIRVFLRLALLLAPFVGVLGLMWFSAFAGQDINYYLAENPPEWRRAKVLAGLLLLGWAGLAAWQLARWLLAIPVMLYEDTTAARALERSAALTRGRLTGLLVPLVCWWLLATGVAILVAVAAREVSSVALAWAGMDLGRVLPLVALFLAASLAGGILYGALHLAGHQFLVTRYFGELMDAERWTLPAQAISREAGSGRLERPVLALTLALLALGLGSAGFLATRLDIRPDVAITAHRGASVTAPENTMAAFRQALDAGAHFIELDVQRTRDGAIAVLHDGDLMRMAGDRRRISDLTLPDLATIDIGARHDARFAGERVPTLAEVIALARGRSRINVELKYNRPDPALAPAVVELLRREQFLDQVVITSLDYAALKQVQALEPGLRTGHIVTAAVGNVTRTAADFVSLNSARATASLVRQAHAAGKDVHVWTVNDPEVMLRMIERGVDSIITDDPALLARVMRDRNALSGPERLGLRLRVLFARAPPQVTSPEAVPEL